MNNIEQKPKRRLFKRACRAMPPLDALIEVPAPNEVWGGRENRSYYFEIPFGIEPQKHTRVWLAAWVKHDCERAPVKPHQRIGTVTKVGSPCEIVARLNVRSDVLDQLSGQDKVQIANLAAETFRGIFFHTLLGTARDAEYKVEVPRNG